MSAQVVTGTISLNCQASQTDTSGLVNAIQAAGSIQYPPTLGQLANGTGLTQCVDCMYSAQLTLSAAATHINLNAFTDILGNSVAAARCRFWAVQVVTQTAAFLINIYTRTGTNPVVWLPITTTAALWAGPGGMYVGIEPLSTTTNGWVVSASHNDFTVDPGANTVVCNVLILCNTAA